LLRGQRTALINALRRHLAEIGVVSIAPLAKIEAYRKRVGWTPPRVSSAAGDFGRDFGVSTESGESFDLRVFLRDSDKIYRSYFTSGRRTSTASTLVKTSSGMQQGSRRSAFERFVAEVFARDQGPRGKVIDFRTPVEIEGVRVAPGDLIFDDREGVLIIPAEVESEAVAAALASAAAKRTRAERERSSLMVIELCRRRWLILWLF
jgi:predicted dithiol-disulfide oxidoreductase (DUF899 family)